MTFEDVCMECISTSEFVREYNRLTGHHLGEHKAIDEVCGYNPDEAAMPAFIVFVYEYVWLPLTYKKQNWRD